MTSPLFFSFSKKVSTLRYLTIKSSKISNRQRHGISPVIATTIILAITISLGLALWGFANSGVGSATVQYSQAIEDYGEIVRNHRYVIANVDFDPTAERMTFWIYNNGNELTTSIHENHLFVICRNYDPGTHPNCLNLGVQPNTLEQYDDKNNASSCPADASDVRVCDVGAKELKKFSINLTEVYNDVTYEVTMVSDAGLTQTYMKKSD